MRTLALLAALLLAFLAEAQTMEEIPDMDSPEDQPWDDEEDIDVPFIGVERYARWAEEQRGKRTCRCGRGLTCRSKEREEGRCTLNKRIYKLCCKRHL